MGIVRRMPKREAKRIRGLVQLHAAMKQCAKVEQRIRVAWLDSDDAAEARFGLLEAVGLVKHQTQVVERRQVVRLDVQRAAITLDRQLPVARGLLRVAQDLQSFGAALQGR